MTMTAERAMDGTKWRFWSGWVRVLVGVMLLGMTSLAMGQEEAENPAVDPVEVPAEEVAAEEGPKSMDDLISGFMKKPSEVFLSVVFWAVPGTGGLADGGIPFVLVWLAGAGIFLTFYFKFINLRSFGLAIRTIKGKYSSSSDPGQITHFQALSAALSATVGLGNIAGVAIAISIGGPGATLWMVLMGLFGMTTKFAECTLGVRYREVDENGKTYGGAMYYLSKGFGELGLAPVGKVLAIFFAAMCILASFGGGNMFQVNQACSQFVGITGGEASFLAESRWVYGVAMALVVGLVIIGGIVSIARVTAKLVPAMCVIYVVAGLIIILMNLGEVPAAFVTIFQGAIAPDAAFGGFIGALIQGVRRATFSNEAGIGSAPIAHSAVRTGKPASEGIVALLEPFVDTVCVCTMTALVIVITGTYNTELADTSTATGIAMTSDAFSSVLGGFQYVLFLAVTLFAFSTLISWSYYGQQAWCYLFGKSKGAELSYKIIFCVMVVAGSAMTLGSVIDFSDASLFAMCFPNLIGVYFLLPKIREELGKFQEHARAIDSGRG